MKKFTVLIERDEDEWLVGSVIELPGCYTQAKTLGELIERIKEAVEAYSNVRNRALTWTAIVYIVLSEEQQKS